MNVIFNANFEIGSQRMINNIKIKNLINAKFNNFMLNFVSSIFFILMDNKKNKMTK